MRFTCEGCENVIVLCEGPVGLYRFVTGPLLCSVVLLFMSARIRQASFCHRTVQFDIWQVVHITIATIAKDMTSPPPLPFNLSAEVSSNLLKTCQGVDWYVWCHVIGVPSSVCSWDILQIHHEPDHDKAVIKNEQLHEVAVFLAFPNLRMNSWF